MKVEYAAVTRKPAPGDHPQAELDPMFSIVLPHEDMDKYQPDSHKLQDVMDWLYTEPAGGAKAWPPAALDPSQPVSLAAIDQGIKSTIAYWHRQTGAQSDSLAGINDVRSALLDFRATEAAMVALKAQPIDKIDIYNEYRASWQADINKLRNARDRATRAWSVASQGKDKGDNASIAQLYTDEMTRITSDAHAAYDMLDEAHPRSRRRRRPRQELRKLHHTHQRPRHPPG